MGLIADQNLQKKNISKLDDIAIDTVQNKTEEKQLKKK